MYNQFCFTLEAFPLEEVSDILSYDASDVVANITDEEFLEGLKKQHQYGEHDELTRGLLDQLLGIDRSTSKSKTKKKKPPVKRNLNFRGPTLKSQPNKKRGKLDQIRSRIKTPSSYTRRPVLSQRNVPPSPPSHLPLSSPTIVKRPKVPLRQLKTIKPLKDDLLDLLPPGPEELGIEMDKLLLATPDNDHDDSDSVSFMSSDESYCDYDDEMDIDISAGQQTISTPVSRPGQKLDLDLFSPLSREEFKSLPKVPIFYCDGPGCTFTTSNETKLKLHSNMHSRASTSTHNNLGSR